MIDGSMVTLNTDSQIRVALTDAERRVDLNQGEAYFKVAKDPKRPFVVEANGKRFVALGTEFSVRREGDAIKVVVTEGRVRVEDASLPLRGAAESPGSASPAGGNAPIILSPGAIARVDQGGVLVQRKTLPEAEEELTWRAGVLIFRNETLEDAIAEFNRYTTRKVVIADPSVAGLKIEGNFRLNNAPAFLELLEAGFPIRVIQESDRIVLTAR
jgi:transmembrane sensor